MTVLRGACFDSTLVLTAEVLSRSYWIRTRYLFSFQNKKRTRLINKKNITLYAVYTPISRF